MSNVYKKYVVKNYSRACSLRHESLQRGFTLIEILLVFSVIAILSVASVVAYSSYNTKQQLNNSAQDILVLLHTAKAKAQAQTASSSCTSLKSYQLMRCSAGPVCKTTGATATTFELQSVCSNGTFLVEEKSLSPNVSFDNSSATTLSFDVLTGGAMTGLFKITNSAGSRTVSVSSYGQITLTEN